MREPTIVTATEGRTAGVFDTLSAGFGTVNRHPWIMAIPVLLDLFFWLGPRISLSPWLQKVFGDTATLTALPAGLLESYSESGSGIIEMSEGFNLLSLLALHYPGLPSIMATEESAGPLIGLESGGPAMGLFLLLPVLGVGLASLYYALIGQWVANRGEGPVRLLGRAWTNWGRLIRFLLLLAAVSLAAGVPLMVMALLFGSNGGLFGFLVTALWVAAIWAQFYLFFLVDAIVISDVGPLQAVRNSMGVVKSHLGSTLGLVVLVWIITLGMPVVWDSLASNAPGTVAAIFGNAYITAGLAAASMIYYRDRIATIR